MQVTVNPQGDTVIRGDSWDGFRFATRPSNLWPTSALRYADKEFSFTIDANGDLVDAENDPENMEAAEVTAFIEYALIEAKSQIDELLTIEERKRAGVR